MGMAAILVKWPGPFEQAFVTPSQGGYTWDLASIGQVVIEKKKFKDIESEICTKVNEWPWPLVIISAMYWFIWLHLSVFIS